MSTQSSILKSVIESINKGNKTAAIEAFNAYPNKLLRVDKNPMEFMKGWNPDRIASISESMHKEPLEGIYWTKQPKDLGTFLNASPWSRNSDVKDLRKNILDNVIEGIPLPSATRTKMNISRFGENAFTNNIIKMLRSEGRDTKGIRDEVSYARQFTGDADEQFEDYIRGLVGNKNLVERHWGKNKIDSNTFNEVVQLKPHSVLAKYKDVMNIISATGVSLPFASGVGMARTGEES